MRTEKPKMDKHGNFSVRTTQLAVCPLHCYCGVWTRVGDSPSFVHPGVLSAEARNVLTFCSLCLQFRNSTALLLALQSSSLCCNGGGWLLQTAISTNCKNQGLECIRDSNKSAELWYLDSGFALLAIMHEFVPSSANASGNVQIFFRL